MKILKVWMGNTPNSFDGFPEQKLQLFDTTEEAYEKQEYGEEYFLLTGMSNSPDVIREALRQEKNEKNFQAEKERLKRKEEAERGLYLKLKAKYES